MREIEDAIRSLERNKMLKKMTIEALTMGSWEPLSSDEPITDPVYLFLKSECAAYDLALSTLREQAERDKGCDWCIGFCPNMTGDIYADYRFCPHCGRPLRRHSKSDLISREAFKEKYLCRGWLPEMSEEQFDAFPAVDAVEVVRCKDCIYQKDATVNCKGFIICPVSNMEITDDDYCSYGERKESEDTQ